MKKIIGFYIFFTAAVLPLSFQIVLPECKAYLPLTEGARWEMQSYNGKGKLHGTVKQKILSSSVSGGSVSAEIYSEMFDEKGKQLMTSQFTAKCEGGTFFIDMKTAIPSNPQTSSPNMEMKIEGGDFLDIPSDPKPGQQLKGGTITISMSTGGMAMMNMSTTVSNRKIEAIETITVPAGTFECVKISYDVESKMMFTIKSHSIEWYAQDIGMVRSETYNEKGKLQGYSVLSSIKK